MSPAEIFPNPLVKHVFFEVRFANLFFIESRIGEFQVQVMKDFPQSELVVRKNFTIIAGKPPEAQMEELTKQQPGESTEKIWQFKSNSGLTLEISTRNLVLGSERHTSYREGDSPFRAVVDKNVSGFLKLIQLPVVQRVGLRYINEGPIFDRTTARFKDCYNSILPVDRFGLENLIRTDCVAVAKSGEMVVQHIESLRLGQPAGDKIILDLDAAAENVPTENLMATADKAHELIAGEFHKFVKDPISQYMREANAK
jgi:uncharacterized protein (TIGR04255 family)